MQPGRNPDSALSWQPDRSWRSPLSSRRHSRTTLDSYLEDLKEDDFKI